MKIVDSNYDWQPELCNMVLSGSNSAHYLDYNRVRFIGIPRPHKIKSGKSIKHANRDDFVYELKRTFDYLSLEKSDATISNLFARFLAYLKWCDSNNKYPIQKQTIVKYCNYTYERYRKGLIKSGSYITIVSSLKVVLSSLEYGETSSNWFESIIIVSNNDKESHEAYSGSDLKKLLPFLRAFFKQTSAQFLLAPKIYIAANKGTSPMSFEWQGKTVLVYLAINKMMVVATFLMSYYTYTNATQLYNIKRPKDISYEKDKWYTMPAFKRRAFKTIHIEIGEHYIDIPKYCMDFFNTLLSVSKMIDKSDNAPLIQACWANKTAPMNGAFLRDFNNLFLRKHFPMFDAKGIELRLSNSRFRATGSQISLLNDNEIETALLLNNSPNVIKRHYSKGNKFDNSKMMQEASYIRAEQAKSKTTTDIAKANLGFTVLTYENYIEKMSPKIKLSAHGTYCSYPFGEQSKKYNRQAHSQGFNENKLACADLLGCFGCEHHVIVQSVEDIWCLLSFKECIEESIYLHLNVKHFNQNFSSTLNYIEEAILPKISKKILIDAENKLNNIGRHPLWGTPNVLQIGGSHDPIN